MLALESDIDWGRAIWIGFGLVLGLAVLWVLHSFVGTFVFALFIYYSTRRIHGGIRDRVGQPTVSATLALGVLALPAVLLLVYVTAVGLQELQDFAGTTDLGPYLDVVRPYLNVSEAVENPQSLLGGGGFDLVLNSLSEAGGYLGVVGTGLLHLFVMFAVAFYLLRDDHRLTDWTRTLGDRWGVVEEYAVAVDKSLEKVFAGNILNAIVTATVGALVYSLLNFVAPDPVSVPYPALVGLMAGLASLIPVVGMKIVYIPVAALLATRAWMAGTGWWFVVLFAGISLVVVDVIPDLVVRPYVSGGSLHTGSLMFAYILGPLLFGWYGLFLGPVILVFVTHFARIVVPELVSSRHVRPTSVDPTYLDPSPDALASSDDVRGNATTPDGRATGDVVRDSGGDA